jgi:hypothetical protein
MPHRTPPPGRGSQVSRLRCLKAQVLTAALLGEASRDAFEAGGGPRVLLLLLDCIGGRPGAPPLPLNKHHIGSDVNSRRAAGRTALPAAVLLPDLQV